MANIHPYLTFNNTKEALDYYKGCSWSDKYFTNASG